MSIKIIVYICVVCTLILASMDMVMLKQDWGRLFTYYASTSTPWYKPEKTASPSPTMYVINPTKAMDTPQPYPAP